MSDKGNGILPDYCFHTHTFRCGHAAMSPDEEYVEDALRNGYRTLGFADHAILPGIHERGMRGDYSLLDGYISSVLSLRKKYEGKIRILLGFEGEYSPEMEGYYRSLLKEKGFDYLILGQHETFKGGVPWHYWGRRPEESAEAYCQDLLAGMRSGLYSYVAHPDLYMLWESWGPHAESVCRRICSLSLELGLPLEVNMGRSRVGGWEEGKDLSHVEYPYPEFWKIAGEMGVSAFLGVDAHSPWDLHKGPFAHMRKLIEDTGVRLLGAADFQPSHARW